MDVRSLLPADDSAFGFDNNADLLVVSPSLLDGISSAADRVSALAVGDPATAPGAETYYTRGDQSQSQHLDGLPLGTVGGLGVRHYVSARRRVPVPVALTRTNLEAIRGLEHPHQLEITVDGERVFLGAVGGDAEAGQTGAITDRSDATDARLHVRVPVKAGAAAGGGRVHPQDRRGHQPAAAVPPQQRRHLRLHRPAAREVADGRRAVQSDRPGRHAEPPRGVFGRCRSLANRPTTGRGGPRRETDAREETCARRILTTLARRAYRRPVNDRRPGSRC